MPDDPSFLTRVRGRLADLHPAERKLVDLLSDFPGELGSYSASELADLAGVSKATVSRFVRRLGYASYEEARRSARDERETGSRPPPPAPAKADPPGPLFDQAERAAQNVRRTFAAIASADLDAMTRAILAARRLWVIGPRPSQPFAAYLRERLTSVVEHVAPPPGPHQTIGEYLAGAAPDDLVILFALRRPVARTEALLAAMERVGARLLLITDEDVPPRAGADWRLRCETQALGPLFDPVAVMGVCHLIADRATSLAGKGGLDRLRRIERINDAFGE